MALVTSAADITIIILNNIEASALTDLLEINSNPGRGWKDLNELTASMLVEKMAFANE